MHVCLRYFRDTLPWFNNGCCLYKTVPAYSRSSGSRRRFSSFFCLLWAHFPLGIVLHYRRIQGGRAPPLSQRTCSHLEMFPTLSFFCLYFTFHRFLQSTIMHCLSLRDCVFTKACNIIQNKALRWGWRTSRDKDIKHTGADHFYTWLIVFESFLPSPLFIFCKPARLGLMLVFKYRSNVKSRLRGLVKTTHPDHILLNLSWWTLRERLRFSIAWI